MHSISKRLDFPETGRGRRSEKCPVSVNTDYSTVQTHSHSEGYGAAITVTQLRRRRGCTRRSRVLAGTKPQRNYGGRRCYKRHAALSGGRVVAPYFPRTVFGDVGPLRGREGAVLHGEPTLGSGLRARHSRARQHVLERVDVRVGGVQQDAASRRGVPNGIVHAGGSVEQHRPTAQARSPAPFGGSAEGHGDPGGVVPVLARVEECDEQA